MSVTKEQVLNFLEKADIGQPVIEFWNDTISPLAIRVAEEVLVSHEIVSGGLPEIQITPGTAIDFDTETQLGWVAFTQDTPFGGKVVNRVEISAEALRQIVVESLRESPDDSLTFHDGISAKETASNLLNQSALHAVINHAIRFGLGEIKDQKKLHDKIFLKAFSNLPKSEL